MSETTPVPVHLQNFAQQKLRHEYGHLVAARVLGFQTGEVVFQLIGTERDHRAWAELFIHMPLRSEPEILTFLEKRVTVLFAGAMAEAPTPSMVGDDYVEEVCFKAEGGARDKEKISELIALHQNISRPDYMQPEDVAMGRSTLYKTLRARAAQLVRDEFDLIDGLAADHVCQLRQAGRGWSFGLQKDEVNTLQRIVSRFQH